MLDLYVLAVLDQLSSEASAVADELVRLAFATEPEEPWPVALEKELHLPARLADQIKTMWRGYQAFEQKERRQPDPVVFAKRVVDENFLPYIEPVR